MSPFWTLVIGVGLSVLGVAVAAWDIWLTLKVNANVMKGFKMEDGKGAEGRHRAAPATAALSPNPTLEADTDEDLIPAVVRKPLPAPQPRAARSPSPSPASVTLKTYPSGRQPQARPAPAPAVQLRSIPAPISWAPAAASAFQSFPALRRHGYPPCDYRDATPSLGEGHKLLKMGMNHARAGNPGLALSFLYPSLQIFSQGIGTRGDAMEAWRAIQDARESTPTLYRRQAGPGAASIYYPKPGLYSS